MYCVDNIARFRNMTFSENSLYKRTKWSALPNVLTSI